MENRPAPVARGDDGAMARPGMLRFLATVLLAFAVGVGSTGCGRSTAPSAAADRPGSDRVPRTAEPAGFPVRPAPDARRTLRALGVLHRWDSARASAYAAGDPERLRHLYTAGSRAGAADVQLLERYAARGLVVRGMRRQVLAVRVRRWTDRRLTLHVTDRLVGAVAVGAGVRQPLPVTGVHRWGLTFERTGRRWVVGRVLARVVVR